MGLARPLPNPRAPTYQATVWVGQTPGQARLWMGVGAIVAFAPISGSDLWFYPYTGPQTATPQGRSVLTTTSLQGFLAHKKTPPPRTLQ